MRLRRATTGSETPHGLAVLISSFTNPLLDPCRQLIPVFWIAEVNTFCFGNQPRNLSLALCVLGKEQ
jgi:hypothetical protein